MFSKFRYRKVEKCAAELLSKAREYAMKANTTTNPTVFFSSMQMVLDSLDELRQYEKMPIFKDKTPSADFERIVSNIGVTVDSFIDRALKEIDNSPLIVVLPEEADKLRVEFVSDMLSTINTSKSVWNSKIDQQQKPISLYTAANRTRIQLLINTKRRNLADLQNNHQGSLLNQIDAMDGSEFEIWCAALLRTLGFSNVHVSGKSGDQGVDILAEKEDIKYAIQCKCYSSDLGNTPIQEVYAGKLFYNCHVGAVMTNRYFTSGGKQLAATTGILLWDRNWILQKATESGLGVGLEQNKEFISVWKDDFFPVAVDIIMEEETASVSVIQRRLKLGYARAARIIDEMEEKGIIGPFRGSQPRAILISKQEWETMKNQK